MLLILLSYLGGVLTIISPCILPVLPFVFARADRPFLRNGLPMLLAMALMFAAVASLAALGGGWAVEANRYGRMPALLLLALFGLAMLLPSLADGMTRPLVQLGARLSKRADAEGTSDVGGAVLLGLATGLLWAPCAGPILGLILTGAALQGASIGTTALLFAYAAGAATSLALALLVGGRVFRAMKGSLGISEHVRKAIGALVLIAVAAVALGLDTGFLARISLASTSRVEQGLIEHIGGEAMPPTAKRATLADEGPMPALDGAVTWLNSPPLTHEQLKGKVVLVDFWTYSCINCIRSIPYVRAWNAKYRDQGLVVIGVHTPEFAFEKDVANVRKAMADLGISYPVAIDNDYAVWRAFQNRYWPAHYFIDAKGRIRHHHFGEGGYAESERVIQQLLAEAGSGRGLSGMVRVSASGAEAARGEDVKSRETYVGYGRAERFIGKPALVHDKAQNYAGHPQMLNAWSLNGHWLVGKQHATTEAANARIAYRFHARDLHLVLGSANGKPVRFRIFIDGKQPGADHGIDVDAQGYGMINGQRLYQLVRQKDGSKERLFEMEFLDPGAQAFAFTFG